MLEVVPEMAGGGLTHTLQYFRKEFAKAGVEVRLVQEHLGAEHHYEVGVLAVRLGVG